MRAHRFHFGTDEIVWDGTFIQVVKRPFGNTVTGKKGMWWEMVKRKARHTIVAIVPITPKMEVILVKVYRVPMKTWVIEPCAGLMDKAGESVAHAAKRELLEETGYTVKKMRKLVVGPYNAGLIGDEIVYFLGTEAKRVQEPQLEDGEDIEVIKVPLAKMRHLLEHPPRGVKVDVKLYAMLYFLERIYRS